MVLPSGYLLVRRIRCLNRTLAISISKLLEIAKRRRRKKMESLSLKDRRQFRRLLRVNRRSLVLGQRILRIVEQREKRKGPREKRVIQLKRLLRLE